MKNIVFVCLGNICRSPMAEFIFKNMANKSGRGNDFRVESRSTSREQIENGIGNPVYPPAKAELAKHGIACDGKRAEQLTAADYGKFDMIIGMDNSNIANMKRILGGDPDGKLCKLMDFTERGGDVADPWYTGDFTVAYRDIYDGCTGLLEASEREKR